MFSLTRRLLWQIRAIGGLRSAISTLRSATSADPPPCRRLRLRPARRSRPPQRPEAFRRHLALRHKTNAIRRLDRTSRRYYRVGSRALSRLRFLRLRLRARADLTRFFWPGLR